MFLAMGVIWGIPYLLIKVAIGDFEPATVVLGRTIIAAAILLPIAAAKGYLRPLLPHWKAILAFTVIEICGPWLLLGYAEQTLSSSLTGLLVAAVPLAGAVLVWATGHEHVDRRRVAGLLVGFAGVAVLVGIDVGTARIGAILAMAGVAIGYAVGPLILARYLSDLPILGVVAVSSALAATVYLPVGLAQWPAQTPSPEAWLSVAGLGVICTGVAFLIFFALIAEVGPARATVITYINPAVAVTLGVVVLNEAFTASIAAGFALILAGSVLATGRNRSERPDDARLEPTAPAHAAEPARAPSPQQAAELA
jgi:drug/metabolite transporter (DMT)-like permease